MTDAHSPPVAYPGLRWALGFTLLGLAVSICLGVLSEGVYHDDDLTHLQMARWSWDYPRYLLHDWGRPGFTVPYALPALLGWPAARVFSGLLTALTAWLAYRIAVRLRVRCAALVPLLLWLQPLTFTLSYTTLTETPLALYFTLAGWLYLRGNYPWSAAVISLCVVTRQEAGVFLILWLTALCYQRQSVRVWIWIVWAPVLHYFLCLAFMPDTPLQRLLEPIPTEEYGSGTWLTMCARWAEAAGLGPCLLGIAGLPVLLRRPGGRLWIGAGLAYFAAHVVIYRLGLFASGGYARFLVPLGPVVAVAAAEAVSQAWRALRTKQAKRQHSGWGGPPYSGWGGPPCPPVRSAGGRGGPPHRFTHFPDAHPTEQANIGASSAQRAARRLLLLALGGLLLLWLATELELSRHWEELAPENPTAILLWLRGGMGLLIMILVGGLELARSRARTRQVVAVALLPGLMLSVALVQPFVLAALPLPIPMCKPLHLVDRHLAHRAAVEWIRARGVGNNHIVTTSPWFDEFLDRCEAPFGPGALQRIGRMSPGDILLWDSRLCFVPLDILGGDEARERYGLVEVWRRSGGPAYNAYCVIIFEKLTR